MKRLHVITSREYDIFIDSGLLLHCGEFIRRVSKAKSAAVITDDVVAPLYLERVITSLEQSGFKVCSIAVKNGEGAKELGVANEIYAFLAENEITRTDVIIALGGGVVGDLAGFAAATYLRGVAFVQLPTTLLAAIDSSIGGKTAVNIKSGKNLVGAFHQPSLVLCDTLSLLTLRPEVVGDGMAEAVKYGLIADAELFSKIERYGADISMKELIYRCADIKRDIVGRDELDTGERMKLNFGHTVGHALEKLSGYALTHGRAVAIGMAVMTRGSERLGLTAPGTAARVQGCLETCGLPHHTDEAADKIAAACFSDKKRDGDSITAVLLRDIGASFLKKLSLPELKELIKEGLSA